MTQRSLATLALGAMALTPATVLAEGPVDTKVGRPYDGT